MCYVCCETERIASVKVNLRIVNFTSSWEGFRSECESVAQHLRKKTQAKTLVALRVIFILNYYFIF